MALVLQVSMQQAALRSMFNPVPASYCKDSHVMPHSGVSAGHPGSLLSLAGYLHDCFWSRLCRNFVQHLLHNAHGHCMLPMWCLPTFRQCTTSALTYYLLHAFHRQVRVHMWCLLHYRNSVSVKVVMCKVWLDAGTPGQISMPPPISIMPGTTPPGSTVPSAPSLPPPMRPQPPRPLYPQRPTPSLAAIQREQQEQMLLAQAMLQQQRQAGPSMGPPLPRRGPLGPPPGPRFPHRPHMGHVPGEMLSS